MTQPKPFLRLFFGVYGWCAGIAALFALVGALLILTAGGKAQHLRAHSAETEATVLTLTEKHRRTTRRASSHSYTVTYSFQVNDRTYTATAHASRDRFDSLSQGDRIPVRFWTQDPSQSEIDFGEAQADSDAGIAIAAFASIATLAFGGLAWRNAREAPWMARHGHPVERQITGHSRTSIKVNGVPLWRAEWRNPDGTAGHSGRKTFAALPRVGQTVTVLTDPDGHLPSRLRSELFR
jgi:hypothetical protein